MTNNTDNLTDRTGRTISTPRDLSKTHKRAYIVDIYNQDTKEHNIFYVHTEWQAQGHQDGDIQRKNTTTTWHPCMVSNAMYDQIPS
jgi:hypothetical protein